jgi:hypothetical protein
MTSSSRFPVPVEASQWTADELHLPPRLVVVQVILHVQSLLEQTKGIYMSPLGMQFLPGAWCYRQPGIFFRVVVVQNSAYELAIMLGKVLLMAFLLLAACSSNCSDLLSEGQFLLAALVDGVDASILLNGATEDVLLPEVLHMGVELKQSSLTTGIAVT